MKEQEFNSQELSFISIALMRNIFPLPKSTELLVKESGSEGDFIFLFHPDYHEKLNKILVEKYYSGAFTNSNSEKDWIALMAKINTAKDSEKINFDDFKPHFLSI